MMVPGGFFRNDIPGGSGSAGDFSGIVELRVVVASGCFFVGATPEDEWSVRFSETVGIFFAGTWMADTGPAGAVTVTVFTVTDSTVPPDVATSPASPSVVSIGESTDTEGDFRSTVIDTFVVVVGIVAAEVDFPADVRTVVIEETVIGAVDNTETVVGAAVIEGTVIGAVVIRGTVVGAVVIKDTVIGAVVIADTVIGAVVIADTVTCPTDVAPAASDDSAIDTVEWAIAVVDVIGGAVTGANVVFGGAVGRLAACCTVVS